MAVAMLILGEAASREECSMPTGSHNLYITWGIVDSGLFFLSTLDDDLDGFMDVLGKVVT